jgi:hypothetical protein
MFQKFETFKIKIKGVGLCVFTRENIVEIMDKVLPDDI